VRSQRAIESREETEMNARKLVVAASVLALAAPAAATARTLPIKPQLKHAVVQKHVVKKAPAVKAVSRPLCICITYAVTPVPLSEEAQREVDQQLIDIGIEPIYGTTGTATPNGTATPDATA
jgi:hypothetical protein